MIPLKDRIPSRTIPYVNYIIIGISVIVFLFEVMLPDRIFAKFLFEFGIVPARYFYPSFNIPVPFHPVLSFFTSMFIHGGWLHIILNMWFLYVFGDNVEDAFGHFKYLLFYIGAGLTGGIIHTLFSYNSQLPSVGASGAIAGVMAAYLFLYPFSRIFTLIPIFIIPFFVEIPAFIFVGWWIFLQLFSGTLSIGRVNTGGVAWWAHIGGFLGGTLLFFLFKKKGWLNLLKEKRRGEDIDIEL